MKKARAQLLADQHWKKAGDGWGVEERYFIYRHENGSNRLKRYRSPSELEEALTSDFVTRLSEITREQWLEWSRDLTGPEKLMEKLTDGAYPVRRRLKEGVLRRLK